MPVKAKFKVSRFEISGYKSKIDEKGPWTPENVQVKEQRTIILNPVYGTSEENKKFFESTPSGEIRLGIVNKDAWSEFELDSEMYITFEKA
jgi:hypothetical protein